MADVDCFTAHGRKDLGDEFKKHLDAGIPEKEAARKVILDEHEKIFNDLNKLKEKVKVPTETYTRPDNSEQIKNINDEYNKKVSEVPIETKTSITQPTETNQNSEGAEPPKGGETEIEGGENPEKIGVHHAALTDLANKLGLPEPERGEYADPKEHAERGRQMMNGGASVDEIDNKANDLDDRISLGRAYLEKYNNELNEIRKSKGVKSEEYQSKKGEISGLFEKIKKLGSKAGRAMTSLQGTRDVDTDNFEVVKNNLENSQGKPATPEQEKRIQELTDLNEKLKKRADDAEAKLVEETEKAFKAGQESAGNSIKNKAKDLANRLRKAAKVHRPGSFSAASPASLAWDGAVEVVAKGIEAGGTIAQAISDGINHIKNTAWYKGLNDDDKTKAEKEFSEWHKEELSKSGNDLEGLQKQFVNKTGNKFSTEEAKDIWDYAKKTYLDKGVSFREMISKVSNDLGLSWRQVSEAVTTPKTKRTSDEMWKKQSELARNRNATKSWVESQDKSWAGKALKKVSGVFRGVSVFGHGGIFVGTHAAPTLFQPSTWKYTVPAFLRGWKFAYGNIANYERRMEELKNSPNYVVAQRAGLKNNPDRMNAEEYQRSQKYLGKLGLAGERGFNAIKVLRQDLFDFHYNKLSETDKADPNAAVSIARLVNNATGASNLKIPEWVNEVSFAGGMEAARWGKLTRNPIEATGTALKALLSPITGKKVSVEDMVFAKVWARRVGEQLATMTGSLLANAAIQNTLNPTNPVNLTNPNKPDFLKFKFGNTTVDPTSGMRGTAMFVYGVGKIPFMTQKQMKGDTRMQYAGKQTFGYGRGKLAPLYSTMADFFTQQDFSRNPMPFSNDKPQGNAHKLTWGEYAWEHAPLPIAEAAHTMYESAIEKGADKMTLNSVLNGIISGAISGTTGFRAGEYNAAEQSHSPFTEKDNQDPTFKYFLDKGMNLPNTSLSNEKVHDSKTKTIMKISDYPKEDQEQYSDLHKKYLKEELRGFMDDNTKIFEDEYGDIRTVKLSSDKADENIDKNVAAGYQEKTLKELPKDKLPYILKAAQTSATKRAKMEKFKSDDVQ